MKQRYRNFTPELCERAVLDCFDGKWSRGDFALCAAKYGGVLPEEIQREQRESSMNAKLEAAESIACEIEQRLLDVLDGTEEDLDLDPVEIRQKIDGISLKVRDIAKCCPLHQIYGHLLVLGLEPLLKARIEPFQFASIPGRGQIGCKRSVERALRKKPKRIKNAEKLDVHHAYQSTRGEIVYALIAEEIPSARWVLCLLGLILAMNPGGALLIGGYPDAWLFNYVMSYLIRHAMSREKVRRGQRERIVQALVAYMDDVVLMGRRAADLKSAARSCAVYLEQRFGLHFKPETIKSTILSFNEEHEHRKQDKLGARGCGSIDIAGYIVHRSYTTIRWKIFKRIRRQYLRAQRDLDWSGTIPLSRAYKVVSYKGYFDNTDTRGARETYKVDAIAATARDVISWAARRSEFERRKYNALRENQCRP